MRRPGPGQVDSPGTAAGLTLDLGCGPRKAAGAVGVDHLALPGVDVVASFGTVGSAGLPFRSGVAGQVYARHVLEHVDDLVAAIEEIHRVALPGGRVLVAVPYFACVSAFADPTHRHFFTYDTFAHFAPPGFGSATPHWARGRHVWFTSARYLIRRRWLRFGRAHRWLGVEWWANRWPRVYESFFPYLLPARELEVELEVVKECSTDRSACS